MPQITLRAIALFGQMKRIRCTCVPRDWDGGYWKFRECPGCTKWGHLQARLHDELRCKPWDWPCVAGPSVAPDEDQAALRDALAKASRKARAARLAGNAQAQPALRDLKKKSGPATRQSRASTVIMASVVVWRFRTNVAQSKSWTGAKATEKRRPPLPHPQERDVS